MNSQEPKRKFDFYVLEDRVLLSGEGLDGAGDTAQVDADLAAVLEAELEAKGQAEQSSRSNQQVEVQPNDVADTPIHDPARPLEVVFIDAKVEDAETLLNGLREAGDEQTEWLIFRLDADQDGVVQITETFSDLSNIDAVHILSHGHGQGIQLGNTVLSVESAPGYVSSIASWGDAFDSDADLLIYGCDLAGTSEGRDLVETLAVLCDCDVAASDDATGHATFGGDWDLEFRIGDVETQVAFSFDAQMEWHHLLLPPQATDDAGDYVGTVTAASPISFWRLGESSGPTATDLAGTSDGTYNNVALASPGALAGDGDTAASFDGVTAYVEAAHDPAFLVDDGSVQLWFNTLDNTIDQGLLSKDSNGFDAGGHFTLSLTVAGELQLRIQDTTTSYMIASAPAIVSAGSWHHAAATFGSNGLSLYLDGQLVASDAYTGGLGTSSGGTGNAEPMVIGASSVVSGDLVSTPLRDFFSGSIDEVAIFGSQLSGASIQDIYAAGVQDYSLDEDSAFAASTINGVLANDHDPEGSPLTVSQVEGSAAAVGNQITLASGALLTLNSDGTFGYDTNGQFESLGTGQSTTDIFTYQIDDGSGGTDTASVTMVIHGVDDIPTTSNGTVTVDEDTTYTFVLGDFAYSDSGSAIDHIQITGLETAGTLQLVGADVVLGQTISAADISAGDLTFLGANNQFGSPYDSFEFRVNNGTTYSVETASVSLLTTSFDTNPDGFVYSDDVEGTSNPTFADGTYEASAGETGGGLKVTLGAGPTGGATSGGWSDTINMASEGVIRVDLDYRMLFNGDYEATEYGEAVLLVDGVRYGSDVNSSLYHAVGDGNGGPDEDSGWISESFEIALGAGTHTIILAAYNNDTSGAVETVQVFFDNVVVDHRTYNTTDINVDAVNDDPVMGADAGVNVEENTTAVGNFSGTDIDAGDVLTYSLSGVDAALFNINSSTGDVTFIGAPDFEAPADSGGNNIYDITVTATDNGVGLLSDSQIITVTVTDGNEFPVMGADTGVNTAENSTTVGTFSGVDPNPGDTLSYTLSGVDSALFNINGSTGEVTFIAAPDFEAPADNGANNVYDITVTATDDGTEALSDSQNVTVTVADANESPVMGADTGVNVAENTTTVGTFAGTDPDSGDTLTYTLSGVDAALFNINSSSGQVTFIAAPDFEAPADSGGNNVYDITMTATDDGTGLLSDSQNVTVTVTDGNEAPTTSNGLVTADEDTPYTFVLGDFAYSDPESTPIDHIQITSLESVGTLRLSGVDVTLGQTISAADISASNLTFLAANNQSGSPYDSFEFRVSDGTTYSAETSSLSLISASFDSNADGFSYSDDVLGTSNPAFADGTYEVSGGETGGGLKVTLGVGPTSGANSGGWSNTFNMGSAGVIQVDLDFRLIFDGRYENTEFGEAVLLVDGIRYGNDTNSSLYHAVGDGNSGPDEDSGWISESFEIALGAGAHTITVAAYNSDSSEATEFVEVFFDNVVVNHNAYNTTDVNVDPVNDDPVMGADTGVNVAENTTAVGTFSGTDVDVGDTLTYSLSGVDAALFNVNSSSGEVTFVSAPNFEAPADSGGDNVYDITVTATDDGAGLLSDSQNITVTVTDANEAPVMGADTGVNVAENAMAVGTFSGTDPDAGDTLAYALSGADAALFNINSSTGQVTFVAAPDFEAPADGGGNNVYDITVTATDDGTGLLSDSQNIAVTVIDQNDAPVMGADTGVNVAENTTAIGTFSGTDTDPGDTLTYTLSGVDAALFNINSSTGQVIFIAAPDFEAPADNGGNNIYDITVTATDDGTGLLSDNQNITVMVTNANEAPVMGADTGVNVAENTTTVGTFAGIDPDSGDTLTYTLSGVDAALFNINSGTGQVTFIATPPDFEAPADNGGNNIYDITVTATDDGTGLLSDSQNATVTVTNGNEMPVMGADTGVNVAENTTAVGTFAGTDPDPGDTLTYTLSGVDATLFNINSGTGQVTFIAAPDFEAPADNGGNNIYDVTVTATDDGTGLLSDNQNITVTVTNANEAPVMGADTGVNVAENTTAVGTFAGIDPDSGDTLTYTLSGVDAALFNINSSTGQVTFIAAPDFEAPADNGGNNIYDIAVTATDDGTGLLSDSQNVTVTVTNGNEMPVMGADTGVNVAENTTTVGTFAGTDPDPGDTLTYTLSGIDAALFNINSGTGQVTFIAAPDFEAPADSGGNNIYDITVTGTDDGTGLLSDSQNVTVTVTDGNDSPLLGADTDVNVAENTTAVGTFAGIDPDSGDTLTYTLSGVDAALFNINSGTGQVTFIAAPDFEAPADSGANNIYDVTVTATDDGAGLLSDSQNIAVTVTNANEAPMMGADTGVNVAENTTTVGAFTGIDPDSGDTLTYTLSGVDAALFNINSSTGQVTFIAAPNFEAPADSGGNNVYDITVTATDDGTGLLSDSQNVTVTVTDGNDSPLLGADTGVNVAENTTAVGTFAGTDPDPGDTLTYTLSGVDAALFNINSSTGQVTFIAAPDFEAPADTGGNNVYDITVTATDDGTGLLSDSQNIAVIVTNANEAPAMGADTGVNVAENTTTVGAFTGTDPDSGDTLTYTLSGVDAALFNINSGTGQVTFIAAPDFEAPADSGGNNIYDITVTATDDGTGLLSDSQNVTVTVTDGNDSPLLGADTGVNVAENTTAVGTFAGTDPDPGDTLTYTLSGVDAALFNINSSTGQVTFIAAPDFEAPTDTGGNNVYDITITATDDGTGLLSDSQNIAVMVTNANEAPVMGADAGVNVAENTTAVGTFSGIDPDSGDTLTYTLSGVDAALFNINSSTGQVTFIAAPNFEAPADSGGNNIYDITVTATDDGTGLFSDSQNVTVTVTDGNDSPLLGADTGVNVAENTTAVGTFAGIDPDPGDTLTYTLSGVDAAMFNINSSTGQVTFIAAPDFEAPADTGTNNVYDITVTATDDGTGLLSDSQNIAVTITNSNETPVMGADTGVNVAENTTTVGTFTGIDPDSGDTLTYTLSGVDAALFNINSSTGQVTFIAGPDFEAPADSGGNNVYDVTVTATDDGTGLLSDSQNITVTVADGNESPVMGSDTGVSVAENTTAVGTFSGTDPDPGDTLTYTLSGVDAALFNINSSTGQVTFIAAPNFEAPTDTGANNVYDITVTATDDGTGLLSDSQNITINITNVNEAPILGPDTGVSLVENATLVGTFAAIDPDVSDTLGYTLSGVDAAMFTIDSAGQLSFIATPDFEAPLDSGGDNVYDLTVTVTDNGTGNLSDSQNVTVSVTNVNEPPVALNDRYSITAGSQLTVGSAGVLQNDADVDSATISAALVTPPLNGTVAFNADGSFTYTPNAGFIGNDSFFYVVNDGALNSNVAEVAVEVIGGGGSSGNNSGNDSNSDSDSDSDSDSESNDNEDEDADSDEELTFDPGIETFTSDQQDSSSRSNSNTTVDLAAGGRGRSISIGRQLDVGGDGSLLQSLGGTIAVEMALPASQLQVEMLNRLLQLDLAQGIVWHDWDDTPISFAESEIGLYVQTAGTAAGLVSVGYLLWALRAGAVLTAVSSGSGGWQIIDPSKILAAYREVGGNDHDQIDKMLG